MQITRIINNNIVISEDNSHREVVLMGRGLGFQRHPGDVIDSDKVEKTYIMKDHGMTHRFQQMVADIPIERLEYLIGQAAIRMIERKLKVTLPQDEAAFIALHIVNAELDLDMTEMVSMTKLTQHILKIVDECFPDQMDKESVFYERFITHLKFFAQRIFTGNEVESDDTEFQEIIRNKYQECLDCVEKIRIYIKNTCNHDITDEEMMYLTVHIKRVITR